MSSTKFYKPKKAKKAKNWAQEWAIAALGEMTLESSRDQAATAGEMTKIKKKAPREPITDHEISNLTEAFEKKTEIRNPPCEEFEKFKVRVEPLIRQLYDKPRNPYIRKDTLFGDKSDEGQRLNEAAFKQRQISMKEGILAQIILGAAPGWEDMKKGKGSGGMDCRRTGESPAVMEVKNQYNTVKGADEKKSLYPTMAKWKKEQPEYRVIWGIVNPKDGFMAKHLSQTFEFDGVKLEKIQGHDLFKLAFTINNFDYTVEVISFVKSILIDYGIAI